MEITQKNIIIAIVLILAIFVLQAFLSSRKQKFLGFILPIASFIFCIYVMVHFKEFIGDHGFVGYEVWGWYALQLFIGNVPTVILLLLRSLFRRRA